MRLEQFGELQGQSNKSALIMQLEKKNVIPQQAIKILEKKGIKATEKEAKKILDFLYILAILVVREYLEED